MCANEANGVAVEEASLDKQELACGGFRAAVDWIHQHKAGLDVLFVGVNSEGQGEVHFRGGREVLRKYLAGERAEVCEAAESVTYRAFNDHIEFTATEFRRRAIDPAKYTIVL
jgi:hypothetical protein